MEDLFENSEGLVTDFEAATPGLLGICELTTPLSPIFPVSSEEPSAEVTHFVLDSPLGTVQLAEHAWENDLHLSKQSSTPTLLDSGAIK